MDNFKTCLTKTPSIVIRIMTVFTKAPRRNFLLGNQIFSQKCGKLDFKKKPTFLEGILNYFASFPAFCYLKTDL